MTAESSNAVPENSHCSTKILLWSGTAASTTSGTATEAETSTAWTNVGVFFASVLVALILLVSALWNTHTSTTVWLIVDNLSLLLHGDWDDLWWEMEILTEVFNTLVGKNPVVVAPGELLLDQSTGMKRLASFDDHEVWNR